jgi:hypothetical protein
LTIKDLLVFLKIGECLPRNQSKTNILLSTHFYGLIYCSFVLNQKSGFRQSMI